MIVCLMNGQEEDGDSHDDDEHCGHHHLGDQHHAEAGVLPLALALPEQRLPHVSHLILEFHHGGPALASSVGVGGDPGFPAALTPVHTGNTQHLVGGHYDQKLEE